MIFNQVGLNNMINKLSFHKLSRRLSDPSIFALFSFYYYYYPSRAYTRCIQGGKHVDHVVMATSPAGFHLPSSGVIHLILLVWFAFLLSIYDVVFYFITGWIQLGLILSIYIFIRSQEIISNEIILSLIAIWELYY